MANKKYRVSLAILTPANYELEVEAESEARAYQKAVDDFNGDMTGMIEDCDGGDIELALGKKGEDGLPIGVYIEEIK